MLSHVHSFRSLYNCCSQRYVGADQRQIENIYSKRKMKQLVEQLKLKKTAGLLKEDVVKAYAEAQWNMDKFMDDNASFDEYYSLIQAKDVDGLVEFLENNVASEERMMQYFPEDGTIEAFAQYLINN